MPKSPRETTDGLPPWEQRILGKDTKEWIVRETDCAAFAPHGLRDISHTRGGEVYKAVRKSWPFFMVVVVAHGRGTVAVGAEIFEARAGHAVLIPPDQPHDLQAGPGGWHFSMLNFHAHQWVGKLPSKPRLLPVHAQPIEALIEAFHREYHGDSDPVFLRQILDILHAKIMRLTNPDQTAGRLWPVWSSVLAKPANPWCVESLAEMAHVSGEHFRRLSRTETGRSPMEHVTWLRMQEASRLLSSQNDLIDEVAHSVGFESERAFRSAFQRIFNCTPSAYRQRARASFSSLNASASADAPSSAAILGDKAVSHRYLEASKIKNWTALNLRPAANARFSNEPLPWFGEDPLLGLQGGERSIHGVPFRILDENKGPAFVLMKSARVSADPTGRALPARVRIPVNRKFQAAYFLHACGWADASGPFAEYRWVVKEKGSEIPPVQLAALASLSPEEPDGWRANIQDWYFGYDTLLKDHVRYYLLPTSPRRNATAQYLYTLRWENPNPSLTIEALEITSDAAKHSTLALIAVALAQ